MDKIYLLRGKPKKCRCGKELVYTTEPCASNNFIHKIACPDFHYDLEHDMYFWISHDDKKEE